MGVQGVQLAALSLWRVFWRTDRRENCTKRTFLLHDAAFEIHYRSYKLNEASTLPTKTMKKDCNDTTTLIRSKLCSENFYCLKVSEEEYFRRNFHDENQLRII